MAAENITELKEFLKKAYDLESTIYSYEQIRQYTQERRNKVYEDCEEALYVKKYEYGDILPRYIQIWGFWPGSGNSRLLGERLGRLKYYTDEPFNRSFHGEWEHIWGHGAPEGYPGKKHFHSDYKIIDDAVLIEKTPEEKKAFFEEQERRMEEKRKKSLFGNLFGSSSKSAARKESPEPTSKEYLAEKAAYEKLVDERNTKLAKAHGELDYCSITEQEIVPFEARAREELKAHYEKNLIHPKYRNFVAISQIYDYFDTGRCDKLEGPDGAYNLFESELRMNTIISDLRVIQQKLDEVINIMYSICSSLNGISATLGAMSTQLDSIQGAVNANTMAINDFNASVCQKLNWV